jgi:nitrate reductase gamma subunit
MRAERWRAMATGLAAAGLLAVLIFVGSRNLRHIDAALVGYTFATLFAAFGIAYRYSMWLQRPPTRLYWRRGWQAFLQPRNLGRNLGHLVSRLFRVFALNRFIWRRNKSRGIAHLLIMWGCVLAAAVTFPLVFGWIHFETAPGDLTRYVVHVFGVPTASFPVDSPLAFLTFYALVWSSLLVIPGVMLAMYRRMGDHAAAALQHFQEDLLPLLLLFAISITGLMLTISNAWMKGYGYEFLALFHAATVIFTLMWLPFGKFFHIFQRPAQLGLKFYQDLAAQEPGRCARCAEPFATAMQIEDLIVVERELGYRYELPGEPGGHYQRICPKCRRKMLALAQGKLWTATQP